MGKTKIQWTDYSWPMINGCMRKSAGCENCYAERLTATRLSKTPKYGGLAVMKSNGPHWTGEVRLHEKSLLDPLRIKKPSRIFVCDMGDLFYDAVPDEWIDEVFSVMLNVRRHVFQILTKRPKRMLEYLKRNSTGGRLLHLASRYSDHSGADEPSGVWPRPNIWLGVSCEDQKTADARIPILLETLAALRWVSAEPLIGPIDLANLKDGTFDALSGIDFEDIGDIRDTGDLSKSEIPALNWIVCGGESGPGARSLDLAWLKSIVTQSQAAKVPVFVKQLGYRPWWDGVSTKPPADHVYLEQGVVMDDKVGWQFDLMKDRKGGLIDEWPEDLKVREFPK